MTISQYLDIRRPNYKGLFPVKIRVSHKGRENPFATGVFLSERNFQLVQKGEGNAALRAVKVQLDDLEQRIRTIVQSLPSFDSVLVRSALATPKQVNGVPTINNVLDWLEYKALECIRIKDSWGTATEYRNTAKFYQKYFKTNVIPFQLLTPATLFDIQRTQIVNYSISTVGKYARHLRAVFNLAIDENFISKAVYPFGINKYVPPVSRKRKHALSRDALAALVQYAPQTDREQYHLDLFLFSFYGNGLNLKDLATLKFADISRYYIIKQREKTKNGSQQEPIKIYLIQEILDIIDRHSNADKSPDNYIFPLLNSSWTSEQVFTELRNLRGKLCRTLTSIAGKLGIEGKLPHGTSRHCFANALKQAGAPMELISETIGHSSVAVTKHYTSDFEEAGITYQSYLLKYTGQK